MEYFSAMWCVSISPHVLCLALLVWSRLHGLRLIHFLPHEPWEFCFPRTVFAAALRISTMWLSSEISLSKAFALWSSSRLGFVIVSVVTDVLVTGCLPHEPCVLSQGQFMVLEGLFLVLLRGVLRLLQRQHVMRCACHHSLGAWNFLCVARLLGLRLVPAAQ